MKLKTFIIISMIFFSFRLFSQETENDKFTLYLSVKDKDGVSVTNTDLWLSDKGSDLIFTGKTNSKGQCNIILIKGRTYSLNFSDTTGFAEISTPSLTSSTSFMTKTIVYNALPRKNNKGSIPDTVRQSYTSAPTYTQIESAIVIKMTDADKNVLKNMEVRLFCSSINKIYIATTGSDGSAYFLVPVNQKYELGIDTYNKYAQVNLPASPLKMVKMLQFQPTYISETVKNDTITQTIPYRQKPTSERVHIQAKVMNFENENLPDEEIYINVDDDSLVYKAITDANGNAQFLIPKGKKYLLSFRYEREIDHLDYTDIDPLAMHDVEIEYWYIGTKKVQEFYEVVGKDKDGFITDFLEMKIDKIPTFENNKITKTTLGYNIDFSSNYMPSALATKEHIYVGGGSGRDFYCFDSKTGTFNWGIKLAESGQSSVVCDSSVILISTESCTLYAINRNNGTLLWSKWLGPDLYSSPSVYKGKVYVTYPSDIDDLRNDKYVLLCLDLRDGKIIWQKYIDKDILASPVVEGDKVYVTTFSGKLYSFDAADGKNQLLCVDYVVSPPTIADGKLYVSLKSNTETNRQELAIYDASTLKLIKRLPGISSAYKNDDLFSDYTYMMNYNSGRVLSYNGNNYIFTDDKLVCSKGSDGTVVWTAEVEMSSDTTYETDFTNIPVVAGNKIIITTISGKIDVYDPLSGKLLKEYDTDAPLINSPVVSNGWIYAGSADGQLISVDTKDAIYTGWSMWNLNGSHNTAVKQ